MNFARETNCRSLHRQLDRSSTDSPISEGSTNVNTVPSCCSSFGIPGIQTLTSLHTTPSNKSDCAETKALAAADKCENNNSTPDQDLPKNHRENSTTCLGSEIQKNSKLGDHLVINISNNSTETPVFSFDTRESQDLSTYIESTIRISDVISKISSSVS